MEDRIKHRLNSQTSSRSINRDTYMSVNLDGKTRLLPSGEINEIVDASEQFNKERQSSKHYRLVGTIRTLFSNPLFNITKNNDGNFNWSSFDLKGVNGAPPFRDRSFPSDGDADDEEDLTYAESVKTHLTELDGWFGYYDPDISKASLCQFFDMEPKRERFSFVADKKPYSGTSSSPTPVKNWELTVTYPHSIDDTHFLVNGGLAITGAIPVSVGGRIMLGLETPVNHGLTTGETVRVSGISSTIDGEYPVQRIGLDNGDLEDNYFAIDIGVAAVTALTQTSLPTGSLTPRMTRIFAGEPSRYYFRKFKKIKTLSTDKIEDDDYDIYQLGFSQNIFGDKIYQFVFNEEIDVSDLTDNLGRPLSEIYVTMVKTDSNSLFTNVSSGLDMELTTGLFLASGVDVPHIRRIHNDPSGTSSFPSHTPLEASVNITDDEFYGDVVEYNRFQVREFVLNSVAHRFNTINRTNAGNSIVDGPRQEGYMYNPHYQIKIRDFSSYIEQGDSSVVGIPDYAEDLGDGRFLWRDLLDIGFNDIKDEAVDYPFLNGCHYIHQNYCVTLKRQDPFDNYQLYHIGDPVGDAITDKFTIKLANDEC